MAGGPWSAVTIGQGRPGLFINFVPTAIAAISPGLSGVVGSIVKAPWGPDNQVVEVTSEATLKSYYTQSDTSPYNAYYEGHHAFLGGARSIKMYRIEGTGALKSLHQFLDGASANIFTINGKYNGVYGNGFSIAVQTNPVVATATDVLVYQGSTLLATYTTKVNPRGTAGHVQEICTLINNDPNNFWVSALFQAEGNSTPASVASPGVALAGGADGAAPAMADFTNAMTALEAQQWDVFHCDTLDGDISGIRASFKAWIDGMRSYGKYVAMVTGSDAAETLTTAKTNAVAMNDPAVVYWYPGVYETNNLGIRTLRRGCAYSAVIAGMYASLAPGDDFTYVGLPNILDLETRLGNAQIADGIANGLCLGTFDGLQYKVEEAINSLSRLGANQGDAWKDIQAINTMDAIATGITISANANYIGKVPNDLVGQSALIGSVRDFLRVMANSRAIEPKYTVGLDPKYVSAGKNVFLYVTIQIIESMKFIYFTVQVGP
jgi:hypothetical protein